MADERDLELLDDYLTHRMSEQDRSAFEEKLQADPNLQQETLLQKRLIQGIKDARVAELKSILNNVPLSAIGPEKTVVTKIVIATAVSVLIVGGVYWFFNEHDSPVVGRTIIPSEQPIPGNKEESTPDTETEQNQGQSNPVESDKNQTSAGTEQSKPTLERKPTPLSAPPETTRENENKKQEPVLDVYVPTIEESADNNALNKDNQQVFSSKNSSLIVETDTENRRYSFHYQFRAGKLFLYGPLEKRLYEILEFFSDEKRTVFLYYKENYYLLDEKDFDIKPLTPITDPSLLKKLRESRSTK